MTHMRVTKQLGILQPYSVMILCMLTVAYDPRHCKRSAAWRRLRLRLTKTNCTSWEIFYIMTANSRFLIDIEHKTFYSTTRVIRHSNK